MPTVNGVSLRAQMDDYRTQFDAIKRKGEACAEALALIKALFLLLDILVAVFLEKTTPKTSRNSGLPPSQTDKDETARRTGKDDSGKDAKPDKQTGDNLRKTTVEETVTVETCDTCGADLSGVDPVERERRIQYDIVFEVVEHRVDAEVKECPECRARTKGRFPDAMPGPLQYGAGLQAFIINLLVAHMLSLRRATALVQAISGLRLSEATCLGYIRRLHDALQSWEEAAIAHLLECPALHADETKAFVPPTPCARHWPQVRRWLTAERGLNAELVDSLRQDGKIYADGRRNAVFPCTDATGTLTGAECVGTRRRADGRRFRGMARGSRKAAGGFWTGKTGTATAPVVFLAESAIDALSALSMGSGEAAAIYASTAGVRQNLPGWLEAFGPTAITCGFDADDAGDAAARALMAADPRVSRTRPEGARDWNDMLKRHPR